MKTRHLLILTLFFFLACAGQKTYPTKPYSERDKAAGANQYQIPFTDSADYRNLISAGEINPNRNKPATANR